MIQVYWLADLSSIRIQSILLGSGPNTHRTIGDLTTLTLILNASGAGHNLDVVDSQFWRRRQLASDHPDNVILRRLTYKHHVR